MSNWTEAELKQAHNASFKNEESIKASYICGCFHCLSIFKSSDINADCNIPEADGTGTIWCPECGIDSVIGDSIGIRITPSFLNAMESYFFAFVNEPWDASNEY